MYKLLYLPVARDDISKAVSYIANTLDSPLAAKNFARELEKALLRLQEYPFSCSVYPTPSLNGHYRFMPVRNYCVFYSVDEASQIVEISRVLYARMDIERMIYGSASDSWREP